MMFGTNMWPCSTASSPVRDPFSTEATTCVPHMPAFPMHPTPSGMVGLYSWFHYFSCIHKVMRQGEKKNPNVCCGTECNPWL